MNSAHLPHADCPFCHPSPDRVFHTDPLIVGLWDAFPVSPGHALLVPRRHVPSWAAASREERVALIDGIELAKLAIERKFNPQGYNIGFNDGQAAGQTIFHLHVHVIPRYAGDVADPRGGVRRVIPSKANYLLSNVQEKLLLAGGAEEPLLPELKMQLVTAASVDIAVAFVMTSGVELLRTAIVEALSRGARVRLLTGDYLDATDPVALLQLLDLQPGTGTIERRIYQTQMNGGAGLGMPPAFHPKAYVFTHQDGSGVAFVGSSNLSRTALQDGVEWNYRVVASRDGRGFVEVQTEFERLFYGPRTTALTNEWVDTYRRRRRVSPRTAAEDQNAVPIPEVLTIPEPHSIQQQALAALRKSRADGATAGLVVLATGLGKTWLSAFDSHGFNRVLFVAHREEILDQAMHTYRRIRPSDYLGHYTGDDKHPTADVVFASIQTLSRQAHLNQFPKQHFDYIVVDEFHHASATTYRRLIRHFEPQFLLGLTATPERSDGADLLELCDGNLVFRCDLAEGITRDLLCPFDYFGVPDEVDYTNIPWRSRRFDEEALTKAVATTARAENALEQLELRGGKRTLAFCVSQGHADFMAKFFASKGKRVAAVHSGAGSAPRTLSLEALQAGDLDIVCAVDMFNEGVDLPDLDTVMMLRPTESKILWLQQFGRGLRRSSPDKRLAVIDYIGNHRTFLVKAQTLFNLEAGDQNIQQMIEQYQAGTAEIPAGCSITYDLKALDILRGLLRVGRSASESLKTYVEDFIDLHGVRPTALEAYRDGYSPRSVRQNAGSWLGFLKSLGVLSAEERNALAAASDFPDWLEVTQMSKSFKMVTLLAMLNEDLFPGAIGLDQLTEAVRRVGNHQKRVAEDFGAGFATDAALRAHLAQNPIAAWTGGAGTGGVSFFSFVNDAFAFDVNVPEDARSPFQELVRELVEWRLAEYFDRNETMGAGTFSIKVNQANGNPILMPFDREKSPEIPEGWTVFLAGGHLYRGNFVKIALNVAEREGIPGKNELPALLRGWFGPNAGAPGTRHQVQLTRTDDDWVMTPVGAGIVAPVLWKSYSREQIPGLFGLEFSASVWQQGFVPRGDKTFLLVTLDKSTAADAHKYKDHFLSLSEFEWQSQNRTARQSKAGESIRDHAKLGIDVLLFVRPRSKTSDGKACPFVYCGHVDFVRWESDNPISVSWKLRNEVPARLHADLKVAPV